MNDTDWRGMDRATRSAAYNNGAAVAESAAYLDGWATRSAAFRARAPGQFDLVYGPKPRNRIDVFTCGETGAPLVVFIHGGYWQRNAKDGFSCMAIGPLALGFDVALTGYTLAPDASLTEIVAETRAALAYLRRRDAEAGVERKLIVSGWSAGGHLAALSLGWPEVDAALAISGIFDLEPLRDTTIGDPLALTDAEIADLSPTRTIAAGRITIAFGGEELPELRRQSRDYQAARENAGVESVLLPIAGAHHYSVLDGLIEPTGPLTQALVTLAR